MPSASLRDLVTPDPGTLTLYLVRHGRTRFNADHRIQGWSDSELTEDGLAGVRTTAERLSALRLDAAYSSPSPRAMTTSAEILAFHPDVPVAPHDGLREFHFGVFEERPEAELVDQVEWPALFREVVDGSYPGLPGGESARTYLDRVTGAFAEIVGRHEPGENVLVVSHGMTLMVHLALSGVVSEHGLANASVTVVRVGRDGGRHVVVVGHDPSGAGEPEAELKQVR